MSDNMSVTLASAMVGHQFFDNIICLMYKYIFDLINTAELTPTYRH